MHPLHDLPGTEQPVVRGGRKFGRWNLPDHVSAENFNHRHVCCSHTEQIFAQGICSSMYIFKQLKSMSNDIEGLGCFLELSFVH